MKEITEKTLIPLSLVTLLVGGIFWLTTLYSEVKANTKAIEETKVTTVSFEDTVKSIDRRLSRIEGKLGVGEIAPKGE